MIIDRLPPFVQRFFSPMEAGLSKRQVPHLWSVVLGAVVTLRAAKVIHWSAAAPKAGHRASTGSFLGRSGWDAPALVDQAAAGLLAAMRPRPGEVAYLILDDTRIAKRGKRMDALERAAKAGAWG